jgi:hypothetical protein
VTEGAAGGSISATGLYTAGSTAGTYHVVATSAADPTRSDSATVTVTPAPVAVAISPYKSYVQVGHTQQFSAAVTGNSNTAVTWSVQGGSANGTIDANGLYTAPSTAGLFTVVATSVADSSKSDSGTVKVTVNPPLALVGVSPKSAGVMVNGTVQFTAAVGDVNNQAVTWSASGGTVSPTGSYTAPSAPGTFTVTATSVADNTRTDYASVTVTTAPPSPAPPAITGLTGTGACKSVSLNWAFAGGSNGYLVARAEPGSTIYKTLSTALSTPGYTDNSASLASHAAYSYQVYALNNGVPGAPATVSVTTALAAPAWKDANGGTTYQYAGDTQISMVWDVSAVAGADDSTLYFVARGASPAGPFSVVTPSNYKFPSFTDAGLASSTHYYYQVWASSAGVAGCVLTGDATTGAPGSAITQKGTASGTAYVITDAAALTTNTEILEGYEVGAVSLGSGSPAFYPGEGTKEGLFTIPNVPTGYNYVSFGGRQFAYYTNTRQFDLAEVVVGAAINNLKVATVPTPVTVTVSGLVPWNTATDHLELYTYGGANDWYLENNTKPAAGDTSASLSEDFQGSPLIDTANGDVVTINDIAGVSGATPFPYGTIQRTCTGSLNPPTMTDGGTEAIHCTSDAAMTPVALTGSANLNWARSQMKTMAAAGAPSGGSPSSQTDFFYIQAVAFLSSFGNASWFTLNGFAPTIVQMNLDNGTTDVTEPISYGNPLAANPKFGFEYEAFARYHLPLSVAATAGCPSPTPYQWSLYYTQIGALASMASQIVPLVGPVATASVMNLAAATGWGPGIPVQVSWTAPATGANPPTHYDAAIYRLSLGSSCATVTTFMGRITTVASQTTVVFPPGLFATQDGSGLYFAEVESLWLPDAQPQIVQPLLVTKGARYARVARDTSTFTH